MKNLLKGQRNEIHGRSPFEVAQRVLVKVARFLKLRGFRIIK
jgi:hypothetical protein